MVTLDQVVERLERVQPHGRYFSALCPFHDDSDPSLLVFEDGAYCLGCLKRFSLDYLWRKVSGKPVQPVGAQPLRIDWREIESNPSEFCWEAYLRLQAFPDLGLGLVQRGLQDRILPSKIGWWQGWYTLPVREPQQKISATSVVLRATPTMERATGERYLTPPRQGARLYVPDWSAVESHPVVFVPFGLLDAEAIASLGFATATSTEGQRFNPQLLHAIRKPLVILPDKGEEPRARKLAASLDWRGIPVFLNYPPNAKDPGDMIKTPKHKNELRRYLQEIERRFVH